jgi:hypothetical protein
MSKGTCDVIIFEAVVNILMRLSLTSSNLLDYFKAWGCKESFTKCVHVPELPMELLDPPYISLGEVSLFPLHLSMSQPPSDA